MVYVHQVWTGPKSMPHFSRKLNSNVKHFSKLMWNNSSRPLPTPVSHFPTQPAIWRCPDSARSEIGFNYATEL